MTTLHDLAVLFRALSLGWQIGTIVVASVVIATISIVSHDLFVLYGVRRWLSTRRHVPATDWDVPPVRFAHTFCRACRSYRYQTETVCVACDQPVQLFASWEDMEAHMVLTFPRPTSLELRPISFTTPAAKGFGGSRRDPEVFADAATSERRARLAQFQQRRRSS